MGSEKVKSPESLSKWLKQPSNKVPKSPDFVPDFLEGTPPYIYKGSSNKSPLPLTTLTPPPGNGALRLLFRLTKWQAELT